MTMDERERDLSWVHGLATESRVRRQIITPDGNPSGFFGNWDIPEAIQSLARIVLELEQRTATLRLTDTGPDPIGPWAEPLATASPLQTASASGHAEFLRASQKLSDDLTSSGKIDVGLAGGPEEITMPADIFAPHLHLQPGQRVHIGRGLVVRVTEPERNDTEGKDRDKTPETHDIRDTQSRVRVRDDLEALIRDYPAYRVAPDDKGAAMVLDRILDRLIDATYGTPACGHLSAIRAGAR